MVRIPTHRHRRIRARCFLEEFLLKFFDMSPDFWLNLQLRWDLYHAQQTEGPALMAIQPRRVETEVSAPA